MERDTSAARSYQECMDMQYTPRAGVEVRVESGMTFGVKSSESCFQEA